MPRKGIMLARPLEERILLGWPVPWICQPKLDGIRCRVLQTSNSGPLLVTSEENPIFWLDHIETAVSKLPPLEYDGEMYCHGMPLEEINSICSTQRMCHPRAHEMQFHIFDYVSSDPQVARTGTLNTIAADPRFAHPLAYVRPQLANNLDDVWSHYNHYLSLGYEGIIVRDHRPGYAPLKRGCMMKFKPKKEDIYPCVGWKEEISIEGNPKGRIGALVLRTDAGAEFSVAGLNDQQKKDFWDARDQLAGLDIWIGYQAITSTNRVPKFATFIKLA